MIASDIFIDTNVLLYAYDHTDKRKQKISQDLLIQFWKEEEAPWLSIQVLQEFYANLTRRIVSTHDAADIVNSYLTWNVVVNHKDILREGMAIHHTYRTSFWDGLILAAAKEAKVKVLLSEDFTHKRKFDGIEVINPFL